MRLMFLVVPVVAVALASVCYADDAAVARAKTIRDGFEENIVKPYATIAEEVKKALSIDFSVSPQLLLPGETVTLDVTARSATSPNPVLEVWEDCYAVAPTITTATLDWKQSTDGSNYGAKWKWTPPHTGNYLLHWRCDIGGDIPEFWRNVSVVEKGWATLILNSTSHIKPRPEPDFHELHLPFSYWAEITLYNPMPFAENFLSFSRWTRQFGDDPGMLVFMGGDYLKDDKTVFYDEPEEVQRTILECYKEFWPLLGFPKPLDTFYTYGMGNGPAKNARSLGINLLGALCADQNWGDGPFKINHWGMPARPYFISQQDFRKPGPPGDAKAMVGIQQCERQTILCRDYGCVYSFESGIEYAFEQYSGITRRRVIDDMVLSREMDFMECFLNAAEQTDHPYLFSTGVEMNGVWPDIAAINRHFMEMLVNLARTRKLAFTTATAAADFMRTHYQEIPESVAYLPDVFAGMINGEKPPLYPDTMEIENARFHSIFRRGETLPYAQYDYARDWNYPDWGNDSIPRRADGYVISNTDDRFKVTPPILDTRLFKAAIRMEETEKATRVVVELDAKVSRKDMTLAIWDIPRTFPKEPASIELTGAKRFIPVRAAYTQNLCGIFVADVNEGKNCFEVMITSPLRTPATIDYKISNLVSAKVFERAGVPIAYFFAQGTEAAEVSFTPLEGMQPRHYAFDSDEPNILKAQTTLKIEPGKPQRISGLSGEDILRSFPGATAINTWTPEQALKQ